MSTTGEQLGAALEELLSTGERRAGAHYTPPEVSRRVAAMALGGPGAGARRVVDLSCGGGALLLAAGDALVAAGADPPAVARELRWGADIPPLGLGRASGRERGCQCGDVPGAAA